MHVNRTRNVRHVNRTRNVRHLARETLRDFVIGRLVRADDFDVHRRGRSEIQNLRHDIRRLEEKLHPGKFGCQAPPQLINVGAGRLSALLLQLHQNFRVGSADRSGVAVSQVNARIWQAHVVNHRLQVSFRNHLVDRLIDLVGQSRCFLDAQSRSRPHVQPDLARVHAGKKVAAEEKHQPARQQAKCQEQHRERPRVVQRRCQRVAVSAAKSLKGVLKRLLIAAEESHLLARVQVGLILVFRAQKIHRHRRHNCARPHVGSQHRENHRFGQRHEQIFRHARKKEHGQEHNADAQRRNERRYRNLLRAVQNRLHRLLAHRQVAVDVFDLHRRVVHQDAHGQGQPAQRHDVDCFAQRAQAQQADQDRKRNRNRNNQCALPVSQEQQDHDRRQARRNHGLTQNSLNRRTHVDRLVEKIAHLQAARKRRRVILQHLLYAVNNG